MSASDADSLADYFHLVSMQVSCEIYPGLVIRCWADNRKISDCVGMIMIREAQKKRRPR